MLASPLGTRDVVLGHLSAIALRVALSSTCFVLVMAVFGAIETWGVVLAVPAAVLGGVALAAPVAAYTVTLDNDLPIAAILRFGITPMFLFSGTFFPISQLPDVLQKIAYVTPLYHGVELVRKVALPDIDPSAISAMPAWVHLAYLLAMTAIGIFLSSRYLARRLMP